MTLLLTLLLCAPFKLLLFYCFLFSLFFPFLARYVLLS